MQARCRQASASRAKRPLRAAQARTAGSMETSTSVGMSLRSASSRFCATGRGAQGAAGQLGWQSRWAHRPQALKPRWRRYTAHRQAGRQPAGPGTTGEPHLRSDRQLLLAAGRAAGARDDVRVLAAHERARAHVGLLLLQHRVQLLGACGWGQGAQAPARRAAVGGGTLGRGSPMGVLRWLRCSQAAQAACQAAPARRPPAASRKRCSRRRMIRTLRGLAQVNLGGRLDAAGQRGGKARGDRGVAVRQALRLLMVLVLLCQGSRVQACGVCGRAGGQAEPAGAPRDAHRRACPCAPANPRRCCAPRAPPPPPLPPPRSPPPRSPARPTAPLCPQPACRR